MKSVNQQILFYHLQNKMEIIITHIKDTQSTQKQLKLNVNSTTKSKRIDEARTLCNSTPGVRTLCRLSIGSLNLANSVGNINTAKSLQKSRKQKDEKGPHHFGLVIVLIINIHLFYISRQFIMQVVMYYEYKFNPVKSIQACSKNLE